MKCCWQRQLCSSTIYCQTRAPIFLTGWEDLKGLFLMASHNCLVLLDFYSAVLFSIIVMLKLLGEFGLILLLNFTKSVISNYFYWWLLSGSCRFLWRSVKSVFQVPISCHRVQWPVVSCCSLLTGWQWASADHISMDSCSACCHHCPGWFLCVHSGN